MFTVGSCTVLYNPNESVLMNLNSYSKCVDVSVVVDNSDTKNEISQTLKNNPNFIYIDMDGNKGIAAALNKGIEYLDSKNIDSMFGLIKKFGFDYIMNSQVLWGDYPNVDALAIYELYRQNDAKYVTTIRYEWDGHVKRLVGA